MTRIYKKKYELDGNKMKTVESLYLEMISVFKFPNYFGHNWDALFDCLCNVKFEKNSCILLHNAEKILTLESDMDVFIQILLDVEKFWNNDYETESTWGHKAINLSILYFFDEENSKFEDRLKKMITLD